MGRWTCDSVYGRFRPLDSDTEFGSNIKVSFKMTYHPSLLRSFVETPELDWHEKTVFIDHDERTRWVFEHNMYSLKPLSATLKIWPSRYFSAYDHARKAIPTMLGSSRLFDKKGHPVPLQDLPKPKNDRNYEKTRSVQKYLKENGGTIFIEIEDRANLSIIEGGRNVERLILFTCGSMGGGAKFTAMQHIRTYKELPKSRWARETKRGLPRIDIPLPQGYRDVVAPKSISQGMPPLCLPGEVL